MWPIDTERAVVWFQLAYGLVLWTTESLRDDGLYINNDPLALNTFFYGNKSQIAHH